VQPQVEVMEGATSWRFTLEADRTTVGKAAENDVALEHDPTASHLHAMLERFPAGWCVTDLGSSNGTWVNGERIWASHRLRHGDEVCVGQTRLIFRDPLSGRQAAPRQPLRQVRHPGRQFAPPRPARQRGPAARRGLADRATSSAGA
jgi:pSer/pThr/pTyr-binding forkhead associated (FHA) protein